MTAEDYRRDALEQYEQGNMKQFLELIKKAIEGDDLMAIVALGIYYYEQTDEFGEAKKWLTKAIEKYDDDDGIPENERQTIGLANCVMGFILYNEPINDFGEESVLASEADGQHFPARYAAFSHFCAALNLEITNGLYEMGYLAYVGYDTPDGSPEVEYALDLWKIGMDEGDERCKEAFDEHCHEVYDDPEYLENDEEDDEENIDDEKNDEENDEVEGSTDPMKCIIIVNTSGEFEVVEADASDWSSLPPLINAERTDDMRCQKFRDVSKKLCLKGTLLGLLDRNGFQKEDIEPNWHASQWYDGYADLMGDMIVCMEDSSYNPISFENELEANRVIAALRKP
ncbi:hypothetical protein [Prevotella sp. E13-27]|uniref:hypothetical protein n=1 Tax=Prevotella sp. E13-27 TaxID=2938122 RepID=UPI002009F5DC|nr:hypothetical protein [Prevotella sp. E13-27]MCK8622760.1 hypothetical protein [Prevotella sp. E13-27]